MKTIPVDLSKTLIQFIKFGVVGLSNTLLSYVVYSALVYAGLYYILASVIAFIAGIFNSFFFNSKFTFKKNEKKQEAVFSFLRAAVSYAVTGLFLQNLLLFLFVDIFTFSKYISPLFCLVITVPLNFILNKYWVFKV